MLETTIKRYQNRSIETAQVLTELIELAKEIREAQSRGENLGLTEDEVAFYDALEVNDSAVQVLGDETLKRQWRLCVAQDVREKSTSYLRSSAQTWLNRRGEPRRIAC